MPHNRQCILFLAIGTLCANAITPEMAWVSAVGFAAIAIYCNVLAIASLFKTLRGE